MSLLLHALSGAEAPTDLPCGLRGEPLARVDEAGLSGWATRMDDVPSFGRADLLDHHQIISCLHRQLEACLPARFPTWLADEAALSADIGRRRAELEVALDAVRGQCEVAVTVLWTAPAEAVPTSQATTPGTRYLRERQHALDGSDRRRERARELADDLERLAGADVVAIRRQVCPSATVALSSAFLAPRVRARALMDRLPRTLDGVRILVNGPWPPYTFAAIRMPEA